MLWVVLKRLESATRISRLIVATSTKPADDAVDAIAADRGIECFRGSEIDCLDRYYQAAVRAEADTIVRLTADNPFVEGKFVDWVVDEYIHGDTPCDYASPELSGTFPIGMKAEVCSFAALRTAWEEARDAQCREHVTLFLYRNPQRFRVRALSNDSNYGNMRWTVDTPSDLAFARLVFEYFGRYVFPWQSLVKALASGAVHVTDARHSEYDAY